MRSLILLSTVTISLGLTGCMEKFQEITQAPEITFPPNNYLSCTRDIEFVWSPVAFAEAYEIVVRDQNGEELRNYEVDADQTRFRPNPPLPFTLDPYILTIRAKNEFQYMPSPPISYKLEDCEPPRISIVNPLNGAPDQLLHLSPRRPSL